MSYKAFISFDTEELKHDVASLRSSLSSTNWLLRTMGLPSNQRQAIVEVQKEIRLFSILQVVATGTGGVSSLLSLASMAGLGRAASAGRQIQKLSKLAGAT